MSLQQKTRGIQEAQPLLLRIEEVAAMLGLHKATVYSKLITPNLIKSVFIGRSRRVPRAELERYIAQLIEEQSGGEEGDGGGNG